MSISNLSPPGLYMDAADKLSIWEKLKYVIKHVTVEPIIFTFVIANLMSMFTNQNLALEKTCRVNLRFNDTVCGAITARNKSGYSITQEAEVQALVQKWEAYKGFLMGSVPVILVIFLGTWSDRNRRRKPLIMLPLLGGIVSNVLLLLCSIFFMQLKMQYSWTSEILPTTFTGSVGVLLLGVFSYVGGLGDEKSKTLRIGTVSMAMSVGISIGTSLSGIMLYYVGFVGIYVITSLSLLGCLLYCYFYIKEHQIISTEEEKVKESIKELFVLKHVKNTFKTCFSNGGSRRRKKMIIIMIISTLSIGPVMGEVPIVYMSMRLRFGWNEVNFSFFSSYQFIIQLIGNTFALAVLSKYFKLKDVTLGIIAMCSKISAALIYAFAPTGYFFYIGGLVDIFYGTNIIALRAMMSKIVPPQELGQSNSVFGICEGLTPLLFIPLYSTLYINTIMFLPGAIFLLSGSCYIIILCLFIWFYYETKNEQKIQLEGPDESDVVKGLLKNNLVIENNKSVETNKV